MNHFEEPLRRAADMTNVAWEITRQQFTQAINETALELGGVAFAGEIAELAAGNPDDWPYVGAYEKIRDAYPGGDTLVLERFKQIGDTQRRQEIIDFHRQHNPVRQLGYTMVYGYRAASAAANFFLDRAAGIKHPPSHYVKRS